MLKKSDGGILWTMYSDMRYTAGKAKNLLGAKDSPRYSLDLHCGRI